jgi:hypothetical protein
LGLGFCTPFVVLSISFFLYFLTLSLQWISFLHTFQKKTKKSHGPSSSEHKELVYFLYLSGVGRGGISYVSTFFFFLKEFENQHHSAKLTIVRVITPMKQHCHTDVTWKTTSKKKHRHINNINPRAQPKT